LRNLCRPFSLVFGSLILLGSAYVGWENFHPATTTAAAHGPAGARNRGFFDTAGFGDPVFVLYVIDWPYTFNRPLCLGDAYSYRWYSGSFYWSGDGSIMVMTKKEDLTRKAYFSAAYDFTNHRSYTYINASEIEPLLKTRGGLGPSVECEAGQSLLKINWKFVAHSQFFTAKRHKNGAKNRAKAKF
jgi:hypothetical protein